MVRNPASRKDSKTRAFRNCYLQWYRPSCCSPCADGSLWDRYRPSNDIHRQNNLPANATRVSSGLSKPEAHRSGNRPYWEWQNSRPPTAHRKYTFRGVRQTGRRFLWEWIVWPGRETIGLVTLSAPQAAKRPSGPHSSLAFLLS